jgi:CO dehydrogenase/acetyl-CoA synthase beta subunit
MIVRGPVPSSALVTSCHSPSREFTPALHSIPTTIESAMRECGCYEVLVSVVSVLDGPGWTEANNANDPFELRFLAERVTPGLL